uniref:Uncharacterized protein n=1 Tax=Anguilla anguilla TaxID=7936 RepID=A0A0E9UZN9_ANGAN
MHFWRVFPKLQSPFSSSKFTFPFSCLFVVLLTIITVYISETAFP